MSATKLKTKTIIKIILSIAAGILVTVVFIIIFVKPNKVLADTYINLDEGYGSSADDSFKTVPAGTITSAVWTADDLCRRNKCLYFNGSSSVSFADNDALDIAAADTVTIEGWFRTPPISSGQRTLVAKYNSSTGSDGGYKIYMNSSGYIVFAIDNNNTSFPSDSVTTTTSYADNKWHHFAAVKNGTTAILLYMDGAYIGTDSSITSATLANTDPFYVGMDGDGSSNGFSGFIDEVKVYRTVRSASQIQTDYLGNSVSRGDAVAVGPDQTYLSNGLLGYWKMDESSGAPLDSSGNSLTLTNNGTTTFTSGKFGNASTFDGSSKYFNTATAINSINSVAFWVYPGNTTNYYISLIASTAYIKSTSGTVSAVGFTSPSVYVNGTLNGTVTASTWNFVVVTSSTAINATAFEVGRANGSYITTGSLMDEVRLYSRVLSPAEITNLYNWGPGPTVYYKFDENSGTNGYDSSGNGNNGTLGTSTTTPTWTSGKYGSALSFDGVDDIFNPTNTYTLNSTDSISVEAWIKFQGDDAGTYGNIWGSPSLPCIQFKKAAPGYELVWQDSSSEYTTAATSFSTNTWYHVAVVRNGSASLSFYINGVLVTYDASPSTTTRTSKTVYVGNDSSSESFNGSIDDVRIYNYPRTAAQVVADMNAGNSGPSSEVGSSAAYWKLDDMQGTTAYDSSLNKLNLTLSAASWTSTGKFNGAWNGDGTKWLSITDASTSDKLDFLATDDFSISLWFRSDSAANPSAGADQYLVTKGTITNSGTVGYAIYADNNGKVNFGIRSTSGAWGASSPGTPTPDDVVTSSSDIYDGNWHHIVAVKSGTSYIYLYVDGRLDASNTSLTATGTLANAITFYLGDDNGNSTNSFAGDLDEVQVFRMAITSDQDLLLYNRGSAVLVGATSTDSSGNASWSAQREYCPPGNTEGKCGSGDPTPVAEWKFDENTGTSVNDTSGNANLGTITPGTGSWTSGKFGSAYNFDNANTIVNAGSASTLDNLPTSGMTVSAWIFPYSQGEGSAAVIVDKNNGATPNAGWLFQISGTYALTFTVDGTTDLVRTTSNNVIKTSQWNHVEVTWDGVITTATSVHIYVNGVETSYATSTNGAARVDDGSSTLYIGNESGQTRTFDGKIDEVRVYNYARTQAQVDWDYNRGGPVGWWKMDESSWTNDCATSTVYDSSGNSLNGKSCPASTGPVGGATGEFNNGGLFDGSNDYLDMGNPTALQLTTTGTVATWVKWSSTTGSVNPTIVCKDNWDTDRSGYCLAGFNGGTQNEIDGELATAGNQVRVSSGTVVNYRDNKWHHVAFTWDSSTMNLYIDGTVVGQHSQDYTPASATYNLYIGKNPGTGSGYFLGGSLDDVRIYNYALSAAQVKMLEVGGAALHE